MFQGLSNFFKARVNTKLHIIYILEKKGDAFVLKLVDDAKTVLLFSSGENNILQVMVKVVKGVRPDLAAIPRNRPPACSGFLSLMQRCWTTNPQARPSFQSTYC